MYYIKIRKNDVNSVKSIVSAYPFEDSNAIFYDVCSAHNSRNAILALSSRSVSDDIFVGKVAKAFGGVHAGTLFYLMKLREA